MIGTCREIWDANKRVFFPHDPTDIAVGLLAFAFAVSIPFYLRAADASTSVPTTASHYEATVDCAQLIAQGRAAGQAGAQGLVILEFGRPAVSGAISGTVDFGGKLRLTGSHRHRHSQLHPGLSRECATTPPFGLRTADDRFWLGRAGILVNDQLLQIADGFRPNVAVPEDYFNYEVSSWTSLISYAKTHGRALVVFGVLTNAPNGVSPQAGYSSLLEAIQPITGQTVIGWRSNISR